MKYRLLWLLSAVFLGMSASYAAGIDAAIEKYKSQGATSLSAEEGQALWQQEISNPHQPVSRSCASCHGSDLTKSGQHIKTKKVIQPMAPSVNPDRYADDAKLEKWFMRNCKWTWGRECTVQEKGDILRYLSQQ